MVNNTIIEICIGNVSAALTASKYPIDRIELNSALELGGLTPTLETLKYLKKHISIPICCMDRIRGGDFCYNENEYEVMFADAENTLKEKAYGIVFGFLNEDKTINYEKTKEMVRLIHSCNAEAVFHKAFDEIEDLENACETLIELGVDRILTSGKAVYPDILKGCETINSLNKKYGNKLQFLPGGGVRTDNVCDVIKIADTGQVHMTSKREYPGGYLGLDEDQLQIMIRNIAAM